MAMSLTVETVTPDSARRMLSVNYVGNRAVSDRDVSHLANYMKSGDWDPENGETITFNCNGDLVNGQHRLLAVIQADIPVRMGIIRGASADAYRTIDSGRKRSVSVRLGIAKPEAQVYTFILRALGESNPTNEQIEEVRDLWEPAVSEAITWRGHKGKYFASAPVTAALAIHIALGNAVHAKSVYQNICKDNIQKLPKIATIWWKHVQNGAASVADRNDVIGRAIFALDPINASRSRFPLIEAKEVRAMITVVQDKLRKRK